MSNLTRAQVDRPKLIKFLNVESEIASFNYNWIEQFAS